VSATPGAAQCQLGDLCKDCAMKKPKKKAPRIAPKCLLCMGIWWWRFTDSNRGPVDYDENALEKYHINQLLF
jgi:hypothetical protein